MATGSASAQQFYNGSASNNSYLTSTLEDLMSDSLDEMAPSTMSAGLPSGGSGQPGAKAVELLDQLRSCMTDLSDVRGIFRAAGAENARFVRQLAHELPPSSPVPTGTAAAPSSTSTANGVGQSDLKRQVAELESENASLRAELATVRLQLDQLLTRSPRQYSGLAPVKEGGDAATAASAQSSVLVGIAAPEATSTAKKPTALVNAMPAVPAASNTDSSSTLSTPRPQRHNTAGAAAPAPPTADPAEAAIVSSVADTAAMEAEARRQQMMLRPLPVSTKDSGGSSGRSGFRKLVASMRWKKSRGSANLQRGGNFRSTIGGGGGGASGGGAAGSSSSSTLPSPPRLLSAPLTPSGAAFAHWDSRRLARWFTDLRLDMYVTAVVSDGWRGARLLASSDRELERGLQLRHPLHLRKLRLAIELETSGGRLDDYLRPDFNVARWLDDLGLRQHTDAFAAAAADPLLLDNLRLADLSHLRIVSLLHAHSLRRGVQAMRLVDWRLDSLVRRAGTSADLPRWTSHQVMEWLRQADLAEYAVNLRGSGVHGALMALEPRFTCDLLAALLSIPVEKSLLRRHLLSNFVELVGADTHTAKMRAPNPLTLAGKVKLKKRIGLFSSSSTGSAAGSSSSETSPDALLCPRTSDCLDQLLKMSTPAPPRLTHL
ncbi:hypothetical protein BOX15_Mlig010569g1 [Macrostomum lignano]|uniref:SAM domain-containing protein n=1 Tax=Macrostomum lignano TaxID=282301 RepID=A0A267GF28_9PLAT|nr:hypothetical protein BOX15_Mlig010569g1 [Macrostomum lignano]